MMYKNKSYAGLRRKVATASIRPIARLRITGIAALAYVSRSSARAIEIGMVLTYFAAMRPGKSTVRALISAFVALVFVVAATPGSMAMPQPTMSSTHSVAVAESASAQMVNHHCDHLKVQKNKGEPCKNMAQCLGMLNCFGMGAVDLTTPMMFVPSRDAPVAFVQQRASGLVHQPDNPPPIL